MKKKVLHFAECVFAVVAASTGLSLQAQVSNPSSWASFVNSSENTLVMDTFKLQTFGDSEWDNWEYTTSGNVRLTDFSAIHLDKLGGKMGLKLSAGAKVCFKWYDIGPYKNVKGETFSGGKNLNKGEQLFVQVYREIDPILAPIATAEADSSDYLFDFLKILNAPYGFDFFPQINPSNTDGYFTLQYAIAVGEIPGYSLFTGNGNWNDTIRWSHLPPARHRNALIQGNGTITENLLCNHVAIHNGSLQIGHGANLYLTRLDLHGDNAFIRSDGSIHLAENVTIHKTFEETGKWYFISFPFDVYPSGIDARFTQKDATPNAGGNYFYVQSYNGDKRASANQSAGNWEVVPIRSSETCLFKKNKGYLIALDEKATDRTLSFSSRPGDIPEDFANTGIITIPLSGKMTSANQENYGWYLCGNPLPAPLALSQIEQNKELDGKIYIYDGNGYTSYRLSGNYALPPFSAFFVKASSPTELKISIDKTPTKAAEMIQTARPLLKSISPEPLAVSQSTGLDVPHIEENPFFFIKDKHLYLQNIPAAGFIRLFNMTGQCVLQQRIQEGSDIVPLPNNPGIYILQIHSAHLQKQYKIQLP